jgi:hypothetical protein
MTLDKSRLVPFPSGSKGYTGPTWPNNSHHGGVPQTWPYQDWLEIPPGMSIEVTEHLHGRAVRTAYNAIIQQARRKGWPIRPKVWKGLLFVGRRPLPED